jgi:hypothetical protein
MTQHLALLLLAPAMLSADFVVKDPRSCSDVDAARPIEFSESPLRLSIPGDAACQGHDDRGGTVRAWKFPHQFQRLAAAKLWKVTVEKGNGDRDSFVLPVNSVVGIFFQEMGPDGKWKAYRGTARNPIALTQPSIVFTIARQVWKANTKQQFLIWDVLTGDASTSGAQMRAESVWIWQGVSATPRKLDLATGRSRISFQSE